MSRFASQASEVALHSPPQFNRRLPTKEPRPQQVKSMTIAAGFRCLDGVLLVADSKHNIGDASYSGPKIWEVECGESGSSIIVTGAGVDSAISDAVDYLRDDAAINGDSVSFKIVESAIKGSGFGKETTLLLGVKIRSENRGRLFRVEEGDQGIVRVSSIESSTFTGTPRAGADSRLLESAPATKRGIRFHPEGAACRGEAPPLRPRGLPARFRRIGGSAALSCGKALPFRAFAIQFSGFRRGCASPVEAQPQPSRQRKNPPSCHSERSEESRSECFQGNARFLVACGSSE